MEYNENTPNQVETNPWSYFIKCLKNFTNFNGRARRAEVWGFYLFFIIIYIAISIISSIIAISHLTIIYGAIMLVPFLAVAVRREHDLGKSGLFSIIIISLQNACFYITFGIAITKFGNLTALANNPNLMEFFQDQNLLAELVVFGLFCLLFTITWLIECIYLMVIWCAEGRPGPNQYGDDPKVN